MSKIKSMRVDDVSYDIGADYSNIDNTPTFKTINGQTITGTGNINIEGGSDEGLSTKVKSAILDCFEHVAWINDQGQTYYDALEELFFPPKQIVSISAVFNQGSAAIYDNASLDDLKQYLVVVATYSDSSTVTLQDNDYMLSGTLTVGTSTITVTYEGLTDTFDVTVVHLSDVKAIETLTPITDSISLSDYTFFIYNDNDADKFEFNHAKKITAIELNINTTGKISLYAFPKSKIAKNYTFTTDVDYTLLGEVTASTTGVQKLTLETPVTLPEGYAIGFKGGAVWEYLKSNAPVYTQGFCGGQKTFIFYNTRALGINVYIER